MNRIDVKAGADLQTQINNANPGDILSLSAGAYGAVRLPNKGQNLPAITINGQAGSQIVTDGNTPAIYTDAGAAGYTFNNLEVLPQNSTSPVNYFLVRIDGPLDNNNNSNIQTVADLPNNITFNGCYFHVFDNQECRHGLVLNSGLVNILNCRFENFKSTQADAQAIIGWNGPGPFNIIGCSIEGAGENIMFGGTGPSWNVVPSDIIIRNCNFTKRLSWNPADPSFGGIVYVVKNLLEFKSGQRALIEGNTFSNCWDGGQDGVAWLINIANYSGKGVERCQNIEYRYNRVTNVCRAWDMGIANSVVPSPMAGQVINNVNIHDNLFSKVGAAGSNKTRSTPGQGGVVLGDNISVTHNTLVLDPNGIGLNDFLNAQQWNGQKLTSVTFRDNIVAFGQYGYLYLDSTGQANINNPSAFAGGWSNVNIGNNILYGVNSKTVFPGDKSLSDISYIGFDSNYSLPAGNMFKNTASDGTDPGWRASGVNPAPNPIPSGNTINTTTTFSMPASITVGDTVSKLTVHVSAADNSVVPGDVTVNYSGWGTFQHPLSNGSRDYTLYSMPTGVYSVVAHYLGSGAYQSSQSNTQTLTILPVQPSGSYINLLYEDSFTKYSNHVVLPTGFHQASGQYYLDCLENGKAVSFALRQIRVVS